MQKSSFRIISLDFVKNNLISLFWNGRILSLGIIHPISSSFHLDQVIEPSSLSHLTCVMEVILTELVRTGELEVCWWLLPGTQQVPSKCWFLSPLSIWFHFFLCISIRLGVSKHIQLSHFEDLIGFKWFMNQAAPCLVSTYVPLTFREGRAFKSREGAEKRKLLAENPLFGVRSPC